MFPREQRIRTNKDVIATFKRGNRASSGPVSCYLLTKGAILPRVTVVVSTKVSKRAVVRNLVKRRLRAALRELSLPKADIAIRGWEGSEKLEYTQLKQHVGRCLQKLS